MRAFCTTTNASSSSLRTLSKAILLGRLGREPEVQQWDNGRRSMSLSLATNISERDENGEFTPKTQWHRIFVRDDTTGFDFLSSLPTGSLLYVEGELRIVSRINTEGARTQYVNVTVSRRDGGTVRVLDSRKDEDETRDSWAPF